MQATTTTKAGLIAVALFLALKCALVIYKLSLGLLLGPVLASALLVAHLGTEAQETFALPTYARAPSKRRREPNIYGQGRIG